jgi:hypothetical protein
VGKKISLNLIRFQTAKTSEGKMIKAASEDDFLKDQGLEVDVGLPEGKPASNPREKGGKKTSQPVVKDNPMAPNQPGKRLYPLKEAARYLGRSEWGMRELIWAKKIPVVREVRKIYLDIDDLNEYINRNKALYD